MKVAPLSIRDYVDDLVTLVESLDSPPLLVGISLGGLLAQLVAARTRHTVGLVAACPSPSTGTFAATPATPVSVGSLFGRHFLRTRPWDKPVYPPAWKPFRRWIANAQTEEAARELFADFLCACESGRAYCEMVFWFLDRSRACTIDFAAVSNPVLAIGGEFDRIVPTGVVRKTAGQYQRGACVEIPGSDHLVFSGDALPLTMGRIDDWIARNRVHADA
jgi:pimeloyl-ACP methyl ester carboxylesterase